MRKEMSTFSYKNLCKFIEIQTPVQIIIENVQYTNGAIKKLCVQQNFKIKIYLTDCATDSGVEPLTKMHYFLITSVFNDCIGFRLD